MAELTGLLTLAGWPDRMRVIVRRERPHRARSCLCSSTATAGATPPSPRTRRSVPCNGSRPGTGPTPGSRTGSAAPKTPACAGLPSREFAINQAWCVAAAVACDLIAWLQLHALDGDLATAEPKRLHYRLLHTAARLTRGQRRRWLRIPATWPWAKQLSAAFTRITAVPAPG